MATANSITVAALDILTAAMQEIGVLAPGEFPSNEDSNWCLQKLQRLIDRYNAREVMIYTVDFSEYTLPAGPNPVTIGPGQTIDVNQRPVDIESIGLILEGGTGVEIPLNKRDDDWWANQRIKGLTSTLPTDFYYSPDWEVGQIFFWPVPTAAHQIIVRTRIVVSQFTSFADPVTLPPAYWDLFVYELACSIAPSFEREPSPTLVNMFKAAQKAVMINNIKSPRLASDAPSQVTNNGRPDFSFLTGLSK